MVELNAIRALIRALNAVGHAYGNVESSVDGMGVSSLLLSWSITLLLFIFIFVIFYLE